MYIEDCRGSQREETPVNAKTQPDDLEAVRKVAEAIKEFVPDDQERIIRWAREKLKLGIAPPAVTAPLVAAPDTAPIKLDSPATKVDIKAFTERKAPPSDAQFAAVVAYYYRFETLTPKESITSADLIDACRQAGRARITKPAQTLGNAHRQGLLDRGERGTYSINTVGENLVAMALPSDGKTAAPSRRARKPAAKARKKTPQKKNGVKK